MAGNDAAAKATVVRRLRDLGFEPLDAGECWQARIQEPLAMLWINQARVRGKGWDWAIAALSRRTGTGPPTGHRAELAPPSEARTESACR